jgi:ArsR family transcriptional regulator, arsenate/arsenite/antimonite-responsive transcriptional repressor
VKALPVLPNPEPRVKGCCQTLPAPITQLEAEELAALGRAFSDPTRVQMLHMLKAADGPVCVCDFTAAFKLGQPTISHHLAKLRAANLIESDKQGIWAFYRLRGNLPRAAQLLLDAIP